jgi:hypothetical protein
MPGTGMPGYSNLPDNYQSLAGAMSLEGPGHLWTRFFRLSCLVAKGRDITTLCIYVDPW